MGSNYEGRPLVMEMEHEEDLEEASASGCGCGCFRSLSLRWWQGHGHDEEGKRLIEQKGEGGGETWVMDKLRKVKEASEVVAGPKWKTFIRKISAYGKNKQQRNSRFLYDERSYALNFNSGAPSDDEDNVPRSFSARFSAPLPTGRRQNEL